MENKLQPKRYLAEIIQCGIQNNSSGKEEVFIQFKTEDGNITWYGHLGSAKAQEITGKALEACGFKGNDFRDVTKGTAIFANDTAMISLEEETYNGKTKLKVKWVNPVKQFENLSASQVKASNPGLFAQLRAQSGNKSKPADDQVPF